MVKKGKEQKRAPPPRLVEGARPYVLFHAPDASGARRRVRLYVPEGMRPMERKRWIKSVCGTAAMLLRAGYIYEASAAPVPLAHPAGPAGDPRASVESAIRAALESKGREVRPRTRETYGTVQGHVAAYLSATGRPGMAARRFGPADAQGLSDHLLASGVAGVTRNNYFQTLRSLWNRMIRIGLADSNPFAGFRRVSETRRGRNTAISAADRLALMDWMERHDQALALVCSLMYYAFCRPIEVARLRIDDVAVGGAGIFFRAEVSKTNRADHVPLPPAAAARLAAHMAAHPGADGLDYLVTASGAPGPSMVGENTFSERHRRALKAAGLQGRGYNLYSWKHSGVCAAFDAGMSVMEIKARCRHASVTQTEAYLRDLRRVSSAAVPDGW